jgi:anti-sigma regulatory factor (Ser/Thr protein kinase)
MEVLCDVNEVELRITDHTPGFEWPEKPALPDTQSESGRGLYLIRALMDHAHYLRSPGENVLVLRKSRRQR